MGSPGPGVSVEPFELSARGFCKPNSRQKSGILTAPPYAQNHYNYNIFAFLQAQFPAEVRHLVACRNPPPRPRRTIIPHTPNDPKGSADLISIGSTLYPPSHALAMLCDPDVAVAKAIAKQYHQPHHAGSAVDIPFLAIANR